VPALIIIEFGFYRFPTRRLDGIIFFYVKVPPVIVDGHIVVPETGNSPETRVFEKTVSSGCIGNQAEKVVVAKVIYPGPGCLRVGNYVLPRIIVEIAVFHYV
jgi:hypothetical protein